MYEVLCILTSFLDPPCFFLHLPSPPSQHPAPLLLVNTPPPHASPYRAPETVAMRGHHQLTNAVRLQGPSVAQPRCVRGISPTQQPASSPAFAFAGYPADVTCPELQPDFILHQMAAS